MPLKRFRNPYKKENPHDKLLLTHKDSISMTRYREGGTWKIKDDSIIEVESCWNDVPTRTVLIRLFKGTAHHSELVNHYVQGVNDEESKNASMEKRPAKNMFPFNEFNQKFLRVMTNVKALHLVEQTVTSIDKNGSNYTLTDYGYNFVIIKLVEMIDEQNFDVIMALLLSKKGKSVPLSHVFMKIIEMRKLKFDQLLLLIDDLSESDVVSLVSEYKSYLKTIEGENIDDVDDDTLQGEVLKKVSTLIGYDLVAVNNGAYSLTDRGDELSKRFIKTVSSIIDFLNNTEMIEMKETNKRYYISLTDNGLKFSKEVKKHFETDIDRIVNNVSILNDPDDHEIGGVLPVHQHIKKVEDAKKRINRSLYIVPLSLPGFRQRFSENIPALIGAFGLFSLAIIILGFFLIPLDENTGFGTIGAGFFMLFVFLFLWYLSLDRFKISRNKTEEKIIQEEYKKRQDLLRKLHKLNKKKRKKKIS